MKENQTFALFVTPEHYRHITLTIDGATAQIALHVNADHSLRGDTPLKLNSYDLGVDIELADALNRLRFEHPSVSVVTITSAHPQIFSAGANIYMLKKSSHAFKVNFCKYTNETRLYLEEASEHSGIKFLAALNGTAAGGGYELALACDRIVLIDDKNANVSLPEVPLLGVLPGTGGLTRLVDKRKVRRDLADAFCTVSEGAKGKKACAWGLVDAIYPKSTWEEGVQKEVEQLLGASPKETHKGIHLDPIEPKLSPGRIDYQYVQVSFSGDRQARITIAGPEYHEPTNVAACLEKGANLWLIKAFRELDDALLRLRFFHRDCGLIELATTGDKALILEAESVLYQAHAPSAHWFVREIALLIGRVLKRLDVTSRSLFAVVDQASAFAGVLAELLFIADRSYGLADDADLTHIVLTPINAGLLTTWSELSRLAQRFYEKEELAAIFKRCDGQPIAIADAFSLGLITFALDDIDLEDAVRVFKEERVSLSPDALSAMEANLRFNGPETLATKIFGRLSAWQNWVFIRDNATGPHGALMSYGEDQRAKFNFERC